MRNGGCVPGHSIRAAFHQRGPAAVSPYVYLLEQTTGRLPTGTHTHRHTIVLTHMLLHLGIWDSNCAHAQMQRPETHIYITSINVHAGAHKHAVTASRR